MPLSNPQAQTHLEQARHNYSLFEALFHQDEYLDWAVTCLFYSALHLVHAHAEENKVLGENIVHTHERRDSYVVRKFPLLWSAYNLLHRYSNEARYKPMSPSESLVRELHTRTSTRS
jgi:hypothetical protein